MTAKEIARILSLAIARAEKAWPKLWLKALDDAADIAQKFFGHQWASEGKEFGSAWADLAPGTKKNRQRKGYKPAHPILVRRGWLRASVIEKRSANAKRTITLHGIQMWSTLKTKNGLNLLTLHQEGTRKMPARKIFKESEPPWISSRGWAEIKARLTGMFIELRREMEGVK